MLDEKFFVYQEDSDFLFKTYHGWTICFFPLAKVVH